MKDDATEARSSLEVYDLGRAEYRVVFGIFKTTPGLTHPTKEIRIIPIIRKTIWPICYFLWNIPMCILWEKVEIEHLLRSTTELNDIKAEFVPVDRGGILPIMGPQVVGYPILDLDRHFTDIHKYLRF